MDAFKFLTRSTNINRTSSRSTAPPNHAPSQGAASNPQLFGSSATTDHNHADTGETSKKRKRLDRQAVEEIDPLPKELDFFGGQTSTAAAAKSKATAVEKPTRTAAEHSDASHEIGQRSDASARHDATDLDEESCRRILKEHKVKITELWARSASLAIDDDDDAANPTAKKRKRTKAAPPPEEPSSKKKKRKLDLVPQPLTSFAQLRSRYDMSGKLLDNLATQGYHIPTEVQLGSLPLLCDPRNGVTVPKGMDEAAQQGGHAAYGPNIDLLTVAPTGSGKTLAFLVPVLNAIMQQQRHRYAEGKTQRYEGVQAVVVAPTKELASQIVNEGRKLTVNTGIKVTLVRKGMRIATREGSADQEAPLDDPASEEDSANNEDGEDSKGATQPATKAQILVSTPLTLVHAAGSDAETLSSVRYLVLDEADVLLDPLFREQTLQIWTHCSNPQLRVSLWSATMGASIEALALSTIQARHPSPAHAPHPRPPTIRLVVGLKDSAIPNVTHKLIYAGNEAGKLMALRQLLQPSTSPSSSSSSTTTMTPPFLVFTQTIPRAIALHSELLYDIPLEAGGASRLAVLHSDLSDAARARVMAQVRAGEVWVLVTTDLLSRGVDFRGVNGVVNYDFPTSSAVYVHRVGRTGRAGREGGVAVTLYSKEDVPFVKNVVNVIAASERVRGGGGGEEGEARRRLLESLPRPSKRDKQQLKKRGVEARRSDKEGVNGATRISTKSGYQRKMENKRKGAARRKVPTASAGDTKAGESGDDDDDNDDEFAGFD